MEIEDHLTRGKNQHLESVENGSILSVNKLKEFEGNLKCFFDKLSQGTYISRNPTEFIEEGHSKEDKTIAYNNYVLLAAREGDFQMLDLFLKIAKGHIKVDILKKENGPVVSLSSS